METHAKRRVDSIARLVAAGLVAGGAMLLGSCAAERESTISTRVTETRTVQAPPRMTDISFVDLHDEPTFEAGKEKVVGTIINSGDRPVSKLAVRVEGFDATGSVVTSVVTPPIDQTIDPFGGRIQFEAFLPRSPAVEGYHAVAIAR